MKHVCNQCNLEMKVSCAGWYRIDMFMSPPKPYKIYCADLLQCPKCLNETLVSNPNAIAEHFQDEFMDLLARIYLNGKYTIIFEHMDDAIEYRYTKDEELLGIK